MAKKQYYEVRDTIKAYPDGDYYVIFGERSNGKSYSVLSYVLENFYKSGYKKAFGYIRRWKTDVAASNMQQVFKSLKCNDKHVNVIEKYTNGEYNDVYYYRKCFYLVHRNEEGEIDNKCETVFGHVFNLSESERIKSTGYPDIYYVILEEFIAESEATTMMNEFTRFTSVLSTIIRNDDKVKIFMLGNTVNRHNIYFKEMGLVNANKQEKNTIEVYTYNDDNGVPLNIICEYCDFPDKKVKKSNKYFAFNKEKNSMIREGKWAIGNYPHLSNYYKSSDILFMYFIIFEGEVYQCEIIQVKDTVDSRIILNEGDAVSNDYVRFTYIHQKTTPIRDPYDHIIFQQDWDAHKNIRRNIAYPVDTIGSRILDFYRTDKVQYQDNFVGDNIRAYMQWSSDHA